MKTFLIVIGVLVVLALIVLGAEGAFSYITGGRTVIKEEVDQHSPMRLESARIKAFMDRESEKVLGYEDKIADLEGRAETTGHTVANLSKKLEGERKLIEHIKGLLDMKQTMYVIGGRKYTFAEVNADALARVEACKKMQEAIAFQESLLQDLNTAAAQGRTNLAEARKGFAQLKNQLAALESRNANADIRMEVAKLTGSLSTLLMGPDSELERAFQNYERRVAQKERRAGAVLSSVSGGHTIDYAPSLVMRDASSAIDQFLRGETASDGANETREPEPSPSPSEAILKDAPLSEGQ